jgi:hypothetical protein
MYSGKIAVPPGGGGIRISKKIKLLIKKFNFLISNHDLNHVGVLHETPSFSRIDINLKDALLDLQKT